MAPGLVLMWLFVVAIVTLIIRRRLGTKLPEAFLAIAFGVATSCLVVTHVVESSGA